MKKEKKKKKQRKIKKNKTRLIYLYQIISNVLRPPLKVE